MKLKHALITGIMIIPLIFSTVQSHGTPTVASTDLTHTSLCSPSSDEIAPLFKVRICFNALVFSVCIVLDCKLHWSDAILPGLGQLFDGYGCEIVGSIAPESPTPTLFEGTSEEMIQSIEQVMQIPPGSLTQLDVGPSPEFVLPDGGRYRVVAKTYEVLHGDAGRYLPFEVEPVN